MKPITITLDIKEIIYDVQNKTYLTGKSRREDDNHEQVANMQANDDDENANQILRSITMAFTNLKTKLGEYLDLPESVASNTLFTPETVLELRLQMPSNYNTATADTIASAAHQYVVCMAIADWFTITDKEDAQDYVKTAAESLKTITEAASKRVRPIRAKS